MRVTNLQNDCVVVVRINDRLPKSSRRKIDLTRRAAKQLGFIKKGLAKVKIEVISEPDTESRGRASRQLKQKSNKQN